MSEKICLTLPTSITPHNELTLMPMAVSTNQIATITDYINQYRALHHAPPLVWDNTIALFSQYWSDYLIKNKLFQHSSTQIYGENLTYFRGYGFDPETLLKLSVKMWYDEISLYDFNKPGFSSATGHFTTLVWKSCTKFGMGFSVDTNTGTVVISYNCSPPSNYTGEYVKNVLPISSPAPVPQPIPIPVPIPIPPSPIPPPILPPVPPSTCVKIYFINSLTQIRNNVAYNGSRTVTLNMINNLINQISKCPNI
jgi:uncharacterized protein YkwD